MKSQVLTKITVWYKYFLFEKKNRKSIFFELSQTFRTCLVSHPDRLCGLVIHSQSFQHHLHDKNTPFDERNEFLVHLQTNDKFQNHRFWSQKSIFSNFLKLSYILNSPNRLQCNKIFPVWVVLEALRMNNNSAKTVRMWYNIDSFQDYLPSP